MVVHLLYCLVKFVCKPLYCKPALFRLLFGALCLPALNKPVGVPYLVCKVSALLYLTYIKENVISCRAAEEHSKTHRICAVILYELERVRRVAKGLGHLSAQLVPYNACKIDIPEWLLAHKLISCHNHPCYPEEDNVRSGNKVICRIVVRKVRIWRSLRPSRFLRVKDRDWPEPGGEPGIKHVRVLCELLRLNVGINLARLLKSLLSALRHYIFSRWQVVCRYLLAPPELPGDAPVLYLLHPVAIGVAVFVGNKLNPAALHRLQSSLRKRIHLKEPLHRELWLYYCICALRVPYRGDIILYLLHLSGLLQHLYNVLAGLESLLPYQNCGILFNAAVVVYYIQHWQVVLYAKRIVVYIVRRGYLKAACSKIHCNILILYYRYLSVHCRYEDLLALKPMVAAVVWIYADCRICHYGLRTGGCNYYIFVAHLALL